MDMRPEWLVALREWAASNTNVGELWLFGSRATGQSLPESDVDLAIVLEEPTKGASSPLGNYYGLGDRWQQELAAIIGRHVSLELLAREISDHAVLLWRRNKERL